jgi:hypothetical protein
MRTVDLPARPYLESKELDAIVRMNTELLSELWILRDRVTVLEHLLAQKNVVQRSEIDAFAPSGELAEELERERAKLVERVVGAAHREHYDVESLKKSA